MAEQDEVVQIRVSVDDQASKQLAAISEQLVQLREAGTKTAQGVAAAPAQMREGVQALTGAIRQAGFIGGIVGGVTAEFVHQLTDLGANLVHRATDFRGLSESMKDLETHARGVGQSMTGYQGLQRQLQLGGMSAKEAQGTISQLSDLNLELQRYGAQNAPTTHRLLQDVADPATFQYISKFMEQMEGAPVARQIDLISEALENMRQTMTARGEAGGVEAAQEQFLARLGLTPAAFAKMAEGYRVAQKLNQELAAADPAREQMLRDRTKETERFAQESLTASFLWKDIGESIAGSLLHGIGLNDAMNQLNQWLKKNLTELETFERVFRETGSFEQAIGALAPAWAPFGKQLDLAKTDLIKAGEEIKSWNQAFIDAGKAGHDQFTVPLEKALMDLWNNLPAGLRDFLTAKSPLLKQPEHPKSEDLPKTPEGFRELQRRGREMRERQRQEQQPQQQDGQPKRPVEQLDPMTGLPYEDEARTGGTRPPSPPPPPAPPPSPPPAAPAPPRSIRDYLPHAFRMREEEEKRKREEEERMRQLGGPPGWRGLPTSRHIEKPGPPPADEPEQIRKFWENADEMIEAARQHRGSAGKQTDLDKLAGAVDKIIPPGGGKPSILPPVNVPPQGGGQPRPQRLADEIPAPRPQDLADEGGAGQPIIMPPIPAPRPQGLADERGAGQPIILPPNLMQDLIKSAQPEAGGGPSGLPEGIQLAGFKSSLAAGVAEHIAEEFLSPGHMLKTGSELYEMARTGQDVAKMQGSGLQPPKAPSVAETILSALPFGLGAIPPMLQKDVEEGNRLRTLLREKLGVEDPQEEAPWTPGGAWHQGGGEKDEQSTFDKRFGMWPDQAPAPSAFENRFGVWPGMGAEKMDETSAKLDQAANTNVNISGAGKISVDVRAPPGTSVDAQGEGFFKSTEITRLTQMMPADFGPAPVTGVSAGQGVAANGTVGAA
jgi:hypothetical protein